MFSSYQEWKSAITDICGIKLTPAYCRKRLEALQDRSESSTRAFRSRYGEEYLGRVIAWFRKAESEVAR